MDELNFSFGIIVIVGVLAAISIAFIAMDPTDVIEPRTVEEKPTMCTMDYSPVCGVDGKTYGNMCMLESAGVELSHRFECGVDKPKVIPRVEVVVAEVPVTPKPLPVSAVEGQVLEIESEFVGDDGSIVNHVYYTISAMQDGNEILYEESHRHTTTDDAGNPIEVFPVHTTTPLGASDVTVKILVTGLGHGENVATPITTEYQMTVTPEAMQAEAEEIPIETSSMPVAPGIHTVNIAQGSGMPGCDETNECYLPYSITIFVGDTVKWENPDSAAHTVTSGNISDGHDGTFDSGLFMAGGTFEFTFDDAGTYDYFCMVHPWMIGKIIVNDFEEMVVIEEPEAEPSFEATELPEATIVSVPVGSAVPGCEETNECYLPYQVNISSGSTVSWINHDSAAHTVTSGTVTAGVTGVFDSGLFMAGGTFEFTFDDAGTYDYFCMVHPWMTGKVTVN